jgi:Xaa-Pro dipeptidase
MNAFRRARLAAAMKHAGVDALVATHPANLLYSAGIAIVGQSFIPATQMYAVAGSDGTVGAAVVPYGELPSVLDLYEPGFDIACYGLLYFETGDAPVPPYAKRALDIQSRAVASPAAGFAWALETMRLTGATVGVDESRITPQRWKELEAAVPGAQLVPAYDTFRAARRVKGDDEVELLRTAARIAEDALREALDEARAGMTERELADRYAAASARRGGLPFFNVVTFGERSALSDTFPTDRPLREGEPMRFDLGCYYRGYPSDIGRTATLGAPSAKLERIYHALLAGEDALFAEARAGATGESIYQAGMEAVRANGLPKYRRHHTGHGIGLEPYEPPTVAPGFSDPIEAGQTFCLETPYYELGWGGAMVEDAIVVTTDGCRVLNETPRTLWRAG